jgi:geranylgeranyl pyrophosphate synthase
MKAAGIQERCEDIIKEYGKKAREIISGLPDSDYKSSLLSFIDTM